MIGDYLFQLGISGPVEKIVEYSLYMKMRIDKCATLSACRVRVVFEMIGICIRNRWVMALGKHDGGWGTASNTGVYWAGLTECEEMYCL